MELRSERTPSNSWHVPSSVRVKPRQPVVLLHQAAQLGRDGAGVSDSGPAENTSVSRVYEAPASSTQLRRSTEDGRRRTEDGRRRNAEDAGSTAIAAGVGDWSDRGPADPPPPRRRAVLTPSLGRRRRSEDKAVDTARHE